jgi:hypothetical protein
MLVDLYTYSRATQAEGSLPGGAFSAAEILQRAKEAGLDAVCFAERGRPAVTEDAHATAAALGMTVFFGVEISVQRGRLLFIPEALENEVFQQAAWLGRESLPTAAELAPELAPHGVLVAITPYERDRSYPQLGDRVFLIPGLHAIAAPSPHHDKTAEELAVEAALSKQITLVGGSGLTDDLSVLGSAATLLRTPAHSQAELCERIRSGDAWSVQIGLMPSETDDHKPAQRFSPRSEERQGGERRERRDSRDGKEGRGRRDSKDRRGGRPPRQK